MSTIQPRRPSTTNLGGIQPATTTSTPTTAGVHGGTTPPRADNYVGGTSRGGVAAGVLPDVLVEVRGFKVVHGTDPGDFYCEHMFFQTQTEARKAGSSVTVNDKGEKLVGFLHIPSDSATYGGPELPQEERHAATREVVGAALRGFYDEASGRVARGPVKLMLNGYGAWGSTVNNPTGDFVTHQENVDAAMKTAFGDNLVSPKGTPYTGPDAAPADESQVLQYVVNDPKSRVTRNVLVRVQRFPVTDDAINGNDRVSVQHAMAGFKPHAVMSMGVGTPTYTAEFHADNGGLKLDGLPTHDDSAPATVNLPENRSLARAIHLGAASIKAEAGRPPDTTASSPAKTVADAATRLVNEKGQNYGVSQPWVNVDPNHALPANVRLGGLSGKWKCNLFGGNSMALGGFEPPYYGNKGKGEYPNANQFYKWSDKYATRFGNKSHFELRGELAPQDVPYEQREAAVKELLKKALPGDLIVVDHQGGGVADGGHVRVAVGTLQADDTIQCAQASFSAAETQTERLGDFTGEERVWVLRPNRPRAATPAPR